MRIPMIYDESQLIDPVADSNRLHTDLSPRCVVRDISVTASPVQSSH